MKALVYTGTNASELRDVEAPVAAGGQSIVDLSFCGICGSDISTVEGHSSRYFEDYITFPFVPGHEIVGDLEDGRRVVIEPVLGHEARGFAPPFAGAAPGDGDDYRHLVSGHLEPGIQTGFCESTEIGRAHV